MEFFLVLTGVVIFIAVLYFVGEGRDADKRPGRKGRGRTTGGLSNFRQGRWKNEPIDHGAIEREEKRKWELEAAEEEQRRRREKLEAERMERDTRAKFGPATVETQQRVAATPNDPKLRLQLGHLMLAVGDFSEARKQYELATGLGIGDDPTLGYTHILCGFCAYEERWSGMTHSNVIPVFSLQHFEERQIFRALQNWPMKRRHDPSDYIDFHVGAAIKTFERVVRRDERDLDSLRRLKQLYKIASGPTS